MEVPFGNARWFMVENSESEISKGRYSDFGAS
jgi:hypothetical protein